MRQTRVAPGATQMKLTGLDIFLAEYRSANRELAGSMRRSLLNTGKLIKRKLSNCVTTQPNPGATRKEILFRWCFLTAGQKKITPFWGNCPIGWRSAAVEPCQRH